MKRVTHSPGSRSSLLERIRRNVSDALRRAGIDVRFVKDLPPPDRADIVEAVTPYTMTDRERIVGLCDAVEYVVASGIEGAIVECGVWRGGSMMAAALTLLESGVSDRELYLFDTFDGMVKPSEHDVDYTGIDAKSEWVSSSPRPTGSDWCNASIDEVRDAMASTAYPMENIHMIEGMVEHTIPRAAPTDIAILRLDVDWYETTAHALEHLADRVVDGGVIIFDDYVYWEGARKAADEWIASWTHPLFLTRVGEWGRMAVIHRTSKSATRDDPSESADQRV